MSDNHLNERLWFLLRANDSTAFALPGQPRSNATQQLLPAGSELALLCTPSLVLPYACASVTNVTITSSLSASRGLAVNATVNLLVLVLRLTESWDCGEYPGANADRVAATLWGERGGAWQLAACSYGTMRINQNRSRVMELALPCSWEAVTCSTLAVGNEAQEEARWQLGGLFRSFTHIMYIMPQGTGCLFNGRSEQRGKASWLNPGELGVFKPGTVMQELIHNFGLFHGFRDGAEYMDGSTFMGLAYAACPSAPELLRLGWATPLAVLSRALLPEAAAAVPNVTIPDTGAGPQGVAVRILPDWLADYSKNLYLSFRTRAAANWALDEEYADRLQLHEALRAADNGGGGSAEDPHFNLIALLDQGTQKVLEEYRLVVQARGEEREMLDDTKGRRMVVDLCRYRWDPTLECRMPHIPTICPPADGYTVRKDSDTPTDFNLPDEAYVGTEPRIMASLCGASPACAGFSFSAQLNGLALLKSSVAFVTTDRWGRPAGWRDGAQWAAGGLLQRGLGDGLRRRLQRERRTCGLPLHGAVRGAYYTAGGGSGDILLDDVVCDPGSHTKISECRSSGWTVDNCGHSEDVGVTCTLALGDVRIAEGGLQGRLEVYNGSVWGTVCDDGATDAVAVVACRQLGFAGGTVFTAGATAPGTGPILLDNVVCDAAAAQRLEQCSHSGWGVNDCSHTEDLGVRCTAAPRPPSPPAPPPPYRPTWPSLPPPPPPPAVRWGSWCYPGRDMAGIELEIRSADSKETCADRCRANSGCLFYVWTTDSLCVLKADPLCGPKGYNGERGGIDTTCWVRTNWNNYYCVNDWTASGYVVDLAACNYSFTNTDLSGCRALCEQSSGCTFFVHYDDGRCKTMRLALTTASDACLANAANTAVDYVCFKVYNV
ncbi:hypothetical protein HYH03_013547 [Edaphochlamys debaryana]|uniref:Uncharacterized protein n=1 Tax=Edaphochlamys debaryana TaxID=47281 RepID=A0A835XQL3_9CHLO|nr:hypothetical protein HYH03_013547 [Edaphochlamys debaryana]|eukprot:KAG2487830.1 hypothetical protein HYH03_013547 [Edaphochlamys debaryana]